MKSLKSTLALLLILSFLLVILPEIKQVKAQGTIYIRSDGSVEGTDKISRDGNVYTLTGDIFGGIQVQKSNIVLDGVGHTLYGDGEIHGPTDIIGMGVEIIGSSNVTVRNLKIKEFTRGIRLTNCFDCDLYFNTLSNNSIGIEMGGTDRLYLDAYSNSNRVSGNLIKDNKNEGIRLCFAFSDIVSGNIISGNDEGVSVWGASGTKIIWNNITNNNRGVYVECSGTIIHHNNFVDNTYDWWDYGLTPWPFQLPFSINTLDDGTEGNYWSKYYGSDANGDGIGDTPHNLYENNTDNYPLIKAVEIKVIPEFPLWTLLSLFLITSLMVMFVRHKIGGC